MSVFSLISTISFLLSFILHSILYPGDVDAGIKTLRQLQAEDDEEERFQADLKRAVLQSLGRFSAILVYISCLTVIYMKTGLLYTYTTSLHLRTHSFIYFFLMLCLCQQLLPFLLEFSVIILG